MAGKRYSFVPPGGGRGYDWSKDYTVVKVSSPDTGGAFALMEDNLKLEFALGLHLHRQHAETCYILDGEINFYIDGHWMARTFGSGVEPIKKNGCTAKQSWRHSGKLLAVCSGFFQWQSGTLEPKATLTFGR